MLILIYSSEKAYKAPNKTMTNYAINLIWFTYDAANHTHKKENGKTEKPPVWKRFTVDDILCLWDTKKEDIELFIEKANAYHPTHI